MADKNDVVIVSAARTPFGRFGGSLRDYDYYELGAIPMREVIKRVNVAPDTVDEVFWGVGDTSACRDPYTPVHQLVELSESIWQRYEDEFIERHLAQEERRERIESDSLIDQSYPF